MSTVLRCCRSTFGFKPSLQCKLLRLLWIKHTISSGPMKTGPKENSPLCKTRLENSSRQNFCKTLLGADTVVVTVDSGPKSLPMRWDGNLKPISLTFNRVNLKYFLAQVVHAGLLLADITSMPQNPTFSRYLTWLGDFNFIQCVICQCEVYEAYGPRKRSMLVISYGLLILPLFNNRRASLSNRVHWSDDLWIFDIWW